MTFDDLVHPILKTILFAISICTKKIPWKGKIIGTYEKFCARTKSSNFSLYFQYKWAMWDNAKHGFLYRYKLTCQSSVLLFFIILHKKRSKTIGTAILIFICLKREAEVEQAMTHKRESFDDLLLIDDTNQALKKVGSKEFRKRHLLPGPKRKESKENISTMSRKSSSRLGQIPSRITCCFDFSYHTSS